MPDGECRDDDRVSDNDLLYRRIIPRWVHTGGDVIRPQSNSFIDRHTGRLSVHIASLTTPEDALAVAKRPQEYLVAIPVALVRELEYNIMHVPTDEDPSHAVICPQLSKSPARRLAHEAEWVVPEDPEVLR